MTHQDFKVQRGILLSLQSKASQEGPKTLSLEHLIGVFSLWGFGIICSIISFTTEVLRKKRILF